MKIFVIFVQDMNTLDIFLFPLVGLNDASNGYKINVLEF